MNSGIIKRHSLYIELAKLLLIAFLISGSLFALLYYLSEPVLDGYYTEEYQQKKNEEYLIKLQNEVRQNEISTRDTDYLLEWVKNQKVISVQIYKDSIIVFDSDYPSKKELWKDESQANYYGWASYCELDFADGIAYVSISGFYKYQMSNYLTILWLSLSFILFFVMVLLGIRNTIKYIQTLRNEIEILEGGNLNYEITVSGKNELSSLAKGLDDMRIAFKEKSENEIQMLKANKRIITEMSHDLRTPLTSVMLYSDILSKGKNLTKQQIKEYADKINNKTVNMKQLTDHLFEYSLISSNSDIEMDFSGDAKAIFYDMLSELCSYLEQKGYLIETDLYWETGNICVSSEYINRIFDNITSNIIKYADITKKITVTLCQEENQVKMSFGNASTLSNVEKGNNIGIGNIKKMMHQMNGLCTAEKNDNTFIISLYFPCI